LSCVFLAFTTFWTKLETPSQNKSEEAITTNLGLAAARIAQETPHSFSIVTCVFVYRTTAVSSGSPIQASCHIYPFSMLLGNFKGCNVGITDGGDLRIMPLRWAQMP
jgi:hypothetical protein